MQIRVTHYMLFAGVAFLLFILTSYYASSAATGNNLQHAPPPGGQRAKQVAPVTGDVINGTGTANVTLIVTDEKLHQKRPAKHKPLPLVPLVVSSTSSSAAVEPRPLVLKTAAKALNSSSSSTSTTTTTKLDINGTAGQVDTAKGVRTSDLYESGHADANSQLCPDLGAPLRLLIIITSAPTHRDARLAIRQTWGHYGTRRDIAIGFLLGATQQQSQEDQLAAESFMYGDLIRGHSMDSYNNLTLKTISMLEWVDTYCPQASFILKTDDDMFINVPRLLQFIEKHHKDERAIYGRLAKKWKPIRNRKSKYYVSPAQYAPPTFPQFCTGPAYLITGDAVHDLYGRALNHTYLKLEDVYTTGIVAQQLGVRRVHVNEFLNRRIAFNQCNVRKAISLHMIKSNEQFDLWKKLLDTNVKCK